MKMKEGFLLRKVGESFVVIPVGENSVDFSSVITLNGTGAFVWECLEDAMSRDEIVDAVLEQYDVEQDVAKQDIDRFLACLKENNLLAE